MRILRSVAALAFLVLTSFVCHTLAGTEKDREALQKTSEAIRAAFARGDVAAVMTYHHPDVIKALGFRNCLTGRDAVEADLRKTLLQFHLEFEENRVENLLVQGDTAVEQTVFAIKSTPKSGGEPFVFKGRTQVVYVRYKESPTGWASIREIIQPATD